MSIINTLPLTLTNGTTADATQVMSLFAWIQSQTNGNACPATVGTSVLKGDGAGGTTAAVAGTDYPSIASPTFTGSVTAPTFVGALTGDVTGNVTGNVTGTSSNVTGVVPPANGGTGQTTLPLAGSALGAIGVGQSWSAPSRASGTVYTNAFGRPIMVMVTGNYGNGATISLYVAGQLIGFLTNGTTSLAQGSLNCIVPSGSTYQVICVSGITAWFELS